LNFPLNQATIGGVLVGPVFGDPVFGDQASVRLVVTAVSSVNSIEYVPSRTAEMLTKRRAVDFCRVATAMCRRPVPFVA
jgi:hypothetical protein